MSGGSPYNGGSNEGAAIYTSTNGNWNGATIFTPTDGSNPVSAGVMVGQFANVHLDGPTGGVFIARVTAVVNAANGAITLNASGAGAGVAGGANARSIVVGGAWGGPGALGTTDTNPFAQNNLINLTNVAGDIPRINMKNDHTYTVTVQITHSNTSSGPIVTQGYASVKGDGGRAKISSASAITILQPSTAINMWADLEIESTATTGTGSCAVEQVPQSWYRCVFHGARGHGLFTTGASIVHECEAYECNKSNTAAVAGFSAYNAVGATFIRCYSHDHTTGAAGTNSHGFYLNNSSALEYCIAENCKGSGVVSVTACTVKNCDFYNNAVDGVTLSGAAVIMALIENCNFLKNAGKGINASGSNLIMGYTFNCGYGAGGMANGGVNVLKRITEVSPFTYGTNATPWTAPDTGNFTVSLADAQGTGRGIFIESGSGSSGTLGTPNIGAA